MWFLRIWYFWLVVWDLGWCGVEFGEVWYFGCFSLFKVGWDLRDLFVCLVSFVEWNCRFGASVFLLIVSCLVALFSVWVLRWQRLVLDWFGGFVICFPRTSFRALVLGILGCCLVLVCRFVDFWDCCLTGLLGLICGFDWFYFVGRIRQILVVLGFACLGWVFWDLLVGCLLLHCWLLGLLNCFRNWIWRCWFCWFVCLVVWVWFVCFDFGFLVLWFRGLYFLGFSVGCLILVDFACLLLFLVCLIGLLWLVGLSLYIGLVFWFQFGLVYFDGLWYCVSDFNWWLRGGLIFGFAFIIRDFACCGFCVYCAYLILIVWVNFD